MAELLDDSVLDQLFRDARSHNAWASQSFGEADMRAIYALARMGPTSVNSSPARFVWVASPEAKDRLAACASTDNAAKIRAAPVTVIVAYDLDFAEKLPQLMPKKPDVKKLFANPEIAQV
ncbi:MAG TPA: nitroreductase family protein, partial [Caulobacteraceae bacterium]|nr:nitroreductase family protein [Caulobacteraceae bacterium]